MTEEWNEKSLHDPALTRHPQDERLKRERDEWKRKHDQIFNEQTIMRAETDRLRYALETAEKGILSLNAHLEASRLINDRLFVALLERVNK